MNRPDRASQVPRTAVGRCRGCGADVLWCLTTRGKRMPLDLEETFGRGLVLFVIDKQGVAQRVGDAEPGHESHFATCPARERFRKKS